MTDRLLDQRLTQWAAQNALPPERADAIRRAILAAPPLTIEALPPSWWHQFASSLATTLRKSALTPQFLTLNTQNSILNPPLPNRIIDSLYFSGYNPR